MMSFKFKDMRDAGEERKGGKRGPVQSIMRVK
jgi:hypothetical protein